MVSACKLHAALILAAAAAAQGCTYVEIPYPVGNNTAGAQTYLIGRTMELGGQFLEPMWFMKAVPRGYESPFTILPLPEQSRVQTVQVRGASLESKHHAMKAKYGFFGNFGEVTVPLLGGKLKATALELPVDGMNEHGLSMSAHTFHQGGYQQGTKLAKQADTHVQYLALVSWVLGQYKTVEEVIAGLRSGTVAVTSSPMVPSSLGLHWSVADRSGASIVVEYVEGELNIHRNTVGVMTNDPSFDWHLRNLNQFANVSPHNPNRARDIGVIETEVGPVPSPVGHGFNIVGLPGDLGPPARFVRTFFLKQLALYSTPPKSEREAIVLATQLINAVDIPNGVLSKISEMDAGDYSQWALIKMPAAGKILFRTYSNMQWRMVDLQRLSAFFAGDGGNPNKEARQLHMFSSEDGIADVTDALK